VRRRARSWDACARGCARSNGAGCAATYKKVAWTLRPLAATMPLLVHNQRRVLDALLDALRAEAASPVPMSATSFLGLLTALARDLRGELYPRFSDIVGVVVGLVSATQVSQAAPLMHLAH
jgi:hypothetical protein